MIDCVRDYAQAKLENKIDSLTGGQSSEFRSSKRPKMDNEQVREEAAAPALSQSKARKRGDGRYLSDHKNVELCSLWGAMRMDAS